MPLWPKIPLGNNTIIILRAALVTNPVDGAEYRDWAHATQTSVPNCMIESFRPRGTQLLEDNRNREYRSGYYRLWVPGDTDILNTDKIINPAGYTLEVYGGLDWWYDFEGNLDHIECLCFYRGG